MFRLIDKIDALLGHPFYRFGLCGWILDHCKDKETK